MNRLVTGLSQKLTRQQHGCGDFSSRRLTLLHPRGQSFWWLAIEPPLLVVFAGVVFGWFVARPLIVDMEARDGTA